MPGADGAAANGPLAPQPRLDAAGACRQACGGGAPLAASACALPAQASALWYDPVFKVETLDGRQVWCKRHYRCSPRTVAADLAQADGSSAGAWTLTTLDNGVISKEHWTTARQLVEDCGHAPPLPSACTHPLPHLGALASAKARPVDAGAA